MTATPPLSLVLSLRVLLPFAAGYFLSYIYRSVNAVIATDLTRDLGLDAADLGFLTSAYFLTFACAQLPLGILLDRFGARRVEASLLLIAALGAAVFALAQSRTGLILGRGLIGIGVCACLMAAFKGVAIWFPAPRLPLVNGVILCSGGLGALSATVPVEAVLTHTDWRGLFLLLVAMTVAVLLLIFFMVPEKPTPPRAPQSLADQVRDIGTIYSSRNFWRIAPASATIQATFMATQGLWAGPWLRDVALLPRDAIANHLFVMAASIAVGFIATGAIAERLARRGITPLTVSIVGMCGFLAAQAGLAFGWVEAALPLWAVFGFLGTSGALNYATLTQQFPSELSGRVNTSLNVLVFLGTFTTQWGMGVIVNQWTASDGRYPAQAYTAAFATMLAIELVALTWLLWSGRRR